MSSPKVWLITGASSGFGRSMTELVLKKGDIAFATARDPSTLADLSASYPPTQLITFPLDVTSSSAVTAAFAKAREAFGRIDVVFNNAGRNLVGEIEAVPEEMARELMELNFWGAVAVSREAIKFFREVNPAGAGGTLLQMSSVATSYCPAASGYYCASKWALEGFSESLSREMDPRWNIKILILEPAMFKTKIFQNSPKVPSHPAYTDPANAAMQTRGVAESAHTGKGAASVDDANEVVYKLVTGEVKSEQLRVPIGAKAFWLAKMKLDTLKATVEEYEKLSVGM
ncbi:NAD(P)-binding protein [Leucogyrophana mollusca]|uniref:NAD(P)-binding protein n=1 Tax=Leucogyrophana mollusca TaxID=85980 RepID=A0ACB8BSH9_9AGAM|nr:NAD(P)-binding protein [Leucogyrophana mollusca]